MFKKLLFKNLGIAQFVLSSISPNLIEKIGKKKAYKTFMKTSLLQGYADFLAQNGVKDTQTISIDDFKMIPVMDKKNYISAYKKQEIQKEVTPYLIYKSSGYSGNPTYWSQDPEDYKSLMTYMDFNMRLMFNIHKKKTLVISMFAMSSWITGQQVLAGLSDLAAKYPTLSIFACGMEAEEALDTISRFGREYEQIVIFSYPLTFKELIDLSNDQKVLLSEFNIYAVIGAEGVTYSWSKQYNSILNKEGENFFRIISSYGTADSGIGIASELTPCQLLKEICFSNPEVLQSLTGSKELPMHFFQYNPLENFFEVENDELLITKDKHIPLVRYNLHDRAKLLSHSYVEEVLKDYNYDLHTLTLENGAVMLNLPFVAIYGRTDGTIILNGSNIYISTFMEALQSKDIARLHTGKFRVKKVTEADNFQNFEMQVELRPAIEGNEELKQLFRKNIVEFLEDKDPGYSKAYAEKYGRDNACIVKFVDFTDETTIKHNYEDK